MRRDGQEILPPVYDNISPNDRAASIVYLEKDGLHGVKIMNPHYPTIPAEYDAISAGPGINVNAGWGFPTYRVSREGNTGYVGENEVKYFRW